MLPHVITHPVKTGRPLFEKLAIGSYSWQFKDKYNAKIVSIGPALPISPDGDRGLPIANFKKSRSAFAYCLLLLSCSRMENFVVSARKYRPTGFEEVVGQEHITTTLKNAIDNNKLAQALLFCGPRGVGKTTCARIVARLINGFEEKTESNSLNIFELDAASNNSVEDIRNLIDQVRYPPQFGKFKVYIIDEVHMLSNAAFNAFLKTLEEPPSYAIFILATTEKHKVIPTILSRCQIFDFNRIQISDIANHLKKIA